MTVGQAGTPSELQKKAFTEHSTAMGTRLLECIFLENLSLKTSMTQAYILDSFVIFMAAVL